MPVVSCANNQFKGRRVRARGLQDVVGRVPSRGDYRQPLQLGIRVIAPANPGHHTMNTLRLLFIACLVATASTHAAAPTPVMLVNPLQGTRQWSRLRYAL